MGLTGDALIVGSCVIGLIFAIIQFLVIKRIKLYAEPGAAEPLIGDGGPQMKTLVYVYEKVQEGATTFLRVEYQICVVFCVCFAFMICGLIFWGTNDLSQGVLTAVAFMTGALTSMGCGYVGMMIATFSNARTSLAAWRDEGYTRAFNTAFRGGSFMGYALCSMGVFMLWLLLTLFRIHWPEAEQWEVLMDCVGRK